MRNQLNQIDYRANLYKIISAWSWEIIFSALFLPKHTQNKKALEVYFSSAFLFIYENRLIRLQSYQLVQRQCGDFLTPIVSFDQPDGNHG